jgi:toxin YoeB
VPAARHSALFHAAFLDDLRYWIETDRALAIRTLDLVEAVLRDPFQGIGKPEPLRHQFAGCWSRRLSREHRMVYRVTSSAVEFLQARYHYR